jgi:hypothetical protein
MWEIIKALWHNHRRARQIECDHPKLESWGTRGVACPDCDRVWPVRLYRWTVTRADPWPPVTAQQVEAIDKSLASELGGVGWEKIEDEKGATYERRS